MDRPCWASVTIFPVTIGFASEMSLLGFCLAIQLDFHTFEPVEYLIGSDPANGSFGEGMNIYVGNLSWNTQESALRDLFDQYGQVDSARVLKDRETGRSRGFGFVEMPNDDEARAAIEALNGYELDGRQLRVNEARPREERPRRQRY